MDCSALVRSFNGDAKTMKKELTEDNISEIFFRLPVKSLIRFRSVSKLWYSLIASPNFISTHSTHSHRNNIVTLQMVFSGNDSSYANGERCSTTFAFFIFGEDDPVKMLSFDIYMGRIDMIGCFNGVICLSLSKRPQKYALWNPATKKIRLIDSAPMDGPFFRNLDLEENGWWYGSGFCFDPATNAFKVAQFLLSVTEEGMTMAQVNVFSTGTNSWTENNIPVPFPTRGRNGCSSVRGATCVNGYMHWHINMFCRRGRTIEIDDMYVLSYDISKEVFKRTEMPTRPASVNYKLTPYNGSLAMFVHRHVVFGIEVDVWVMNDCGGPNQSWSKLLTCKPSIKVKNAVGFFRKDGVDFILLYEEPGNCSLNLYDPVSGETKAFGRRETILEIFPYSESLASLN